MPLYLITVKTWEGRLIQGVRQHDNPNLDVVYRVFQEKTLVHFQRVKGFDCYMITKMSTWYAVYRHMLEKQEERRKDRKVFGEKRVEQLAFSQGSSKGPGKYRTRKDESEDHDWGKSKREKLDPPTPVSSSLKHIENIAVFGDDYKTLTISEPNGAGGILHISVDRYYEGIIEIVSFNFECTS